MVQFKRKILLLVLSALIFIPELQAKELQFNDVLQTAFARHPDLQSSHLSIEMKVAEGAQLDGVLDTRYGAKLGFSDEVSPTTSPFAAEQTSASFVAGQISRPFSDGSSLTGSINYNRAELTYPGSVPLNFRSDPNPIYQHQIDLIYRYPLANGSGKPSYHLQKEANEQEVKAARLSVLMLKEQLANQAIGLYFQLVFNDLSMKLADDAVIRAKQLLTYQKKRERFGLIEKAERLQAEALLAMRQLQLVQAIAARDMAQTSLNRFMFEDGDEPVTPLLTSVSITDGAVEELLQKAKMNRPVFAVLEAQIEAAKARLAMAEANDDYQLDVVGQVGSRALDGNAGAALGQGFTLNDRYIAVQLEFSDVWNHTAGRAAIQKGVLAVENINYERLKVIENLKTELAGVKSRLRNGAVILKASKQQVAAEGKKYRAEMVRYSEGRSTTAIVNQFEGDLRASELRALIEQVSLDKATYQLALALGELSLVLGAEQ